MRISSQPTQYTGQPAFGRTHVIPFFKVSQYFNHLGQLHADQTINYIDTIAQITGDPAIESLKGDDNEGFDIVSFMDSFNYYQVSKDHPTRGDGRFMYVLTNTDTPSASTVSKPRKTPKGQGKRRRLPSAIEAMRFNSDRGPLDTFLKQEAANGHINYVLDGSQN